MFELKANKEKNELSVKNMKQKDAHELEEYFLGWSHIEVDSTELKERERHSLIFKFKETSREKKNEENRIIHGNAISYYFKMLEVHKSTAKIIDNKVYSKNYLENLAKFAKELGMLDGGMPIFNYQDKIPELVNKLLMKGLVPKNAPAE